ncbi:MAG: nitroreductase family protein [Candidatus Acidiferrales bacterium]
MEKPAPTQVRIHEHLTRRWSPRAFEDRLVEPEKLRRLFEAARWSPSSANEQPWYFIVATKDNAEEFARALQCLRPGNIGWAKDAPVLVFTVTRLNWTKNNEPNRHAQYDMGQSIAHLTFEAMAEGLFVHQMGGFFPEKVKDAYGVPDGYEPMTAVAIGYGGELSTLPEDLRQRELQPRTRKDLDGFVFSGHWNSTSPIVRA